VREIRRKNAAAAEAPISSTVAEKCITFLDDFCLYLQEVSYQHRSKASSAADPGVVAKLVEFPFADEICKLRLSLETRECGGLQTHSRKQRQLFQLLDREIALARESISVADKAAIAAAKSGLAASAAQLAIDTTDQQQQQLANESRLLAEYNRLYCSLFPASFSFLSEFLRSWTEFVPSIRDLVTATKDTSSKSDMCANKTENAAAADDEEVVNDENEHVEQEGCPNDTAFNEWSHHCTVASCDDEILKRSMVDDDSTISFVFGLEVNWQLLQVGE
jgi:hypothetical protein